ncbi:MAG: hypothetical protein OSB41_15760 [Kiritimatiellae bacterium]|nr:hypothetical protein [Kiritimatiellia bacterium]
MRYRRFGKTEVNLSQVSLKSIHFTGNLPEELAIATLEKAVA